MIGTPLTSSITKYGRPVSRRAGVEHLGDVGVVHHRQRLPLGLEARDDLLRVHAELDDLERDAAPHRLALLGHEHGAESAFADLLQQLVGADRCAEALQAGLGRGMRRRGGRVGRVVHVKLPADSGRCRRPAAIRER